MDRRKALRNTGLVASGAIVIPSLLSLLQSCQAESGLDWQPMSLSDDDAAFVSKIVDLILPRTTTPGALDVKVDMFIDRVIAKTYDADQQKEFKSKIAQFNTDCKSDFGESFINLSATDQIAVLKKAENNSGNFNGAVWGSAVGTQEPTGFYKSLKSMAIWAYFTSEEIGEKVLSYDPIPQEYDGCKPLTDIGNRWSL